jgi:hypothetical protein
MSQTEAYSLGVKIAFWCLWSLCAVFLLPFAYSIIYMISISIPPVRQVEIFTINWPRGSWSLLVILAESIILFRLTSQFLRRAKPASLLISDLAFTAFGMPFVAYGGCMIMISSWGK